MLADTLIVIGLSTISLGSIQEADGVAERTFWLRNAGTEAVQLVQGYTSCGCTTIAFAKDSCIVVGDSTAVTLRFNPRGKSDEFYESGTIAYQPANAPQATKKKHVSMALEGTCRSSEESLAQQFPIRVTDNLWLSTNRFDLGIMRRGESRERSVVLLHRNDADRREVVTLTVTIDNDMPPGLHHLERSIEAKSDNRDITIGITFDVMVK